MILRTMDCAMLHGNERLRRSHSTISTIEEFSGRRYEIVEPMAKITSLFCDWMEEGKSTEEALGLVHERLVAEGALGVEQQ
jgi:hypothetical protein